MPAPLENKRPMIVGKPVLIVIDIQKSTFADIADGDRAIDHMPNYAERMLNARPIIDRAHACAVPVIFIQEVHRPDMVDFGRELDGNEAVHCLENNPMTAIAADEMGVQPGDYHISKRRYSAFFGTDLEILLKGLKAETLLLCGGLTDVCVHYTFVDGHQHDYYVRVIEDAVAGSTIRAHDGALEAMEYLQAGARRSLSEVLDGLDAYRRRARD